MKASEVLEQYAKGKRDFQGVDLKGQSFQGKNLTGADFSEADIRGVNFGNAVLTGTNFSRVRAGLQNRSLITLQILSLILSILSGFIAVFAGYWTVLNYSNANIFIPTVIIFLFFCLVAAIRGIGSVSVVAVLIGILSLSALLTIDLLVMVSHPDWPIPLKEIAVAVAVTGVAVVAIAVAIIMALAIAIATLTANSRVRTWRGLILMIVAVLVATVTAQGFLTAQVIIEIAIETSLIGGGAGFYLAWQALSGDSRQAIIQKTSIAIAIFIGGTSFRGSNLTDANFTKAIIESTDFRDSTNLTKLTRTCWIDAKKLELIRPGRTYLRNVQVRKLAVTGNGKNQVFDHQDLRGINLQQANLEDASFIDTDFYQANLRGANLSRAKLVRTQFERADLRGACLTGSCIQDWGITKETKLDGIVCDYVFLKWIDGDKRDQMPPRGKFKEGAFVLFIKYILDTIEIYHDKDINPRLALSILKKMSKDYDESLDIVAVGKRGERVFVEVRLSEKVEQERFKQDYYSRYDKGLKLVSSNPKQLPSVDELVENKIIEIASEKIPDDNQTIQVTHVEYIMSGNFGVGVNQGNLFADTIAGAINDE